MRFFRVSRMQNKRIILQYMVRYGVVVLVTACLMLALLNWILQRYKEELITDTKEDLHTSLRELDEYLESQQEVAREIYLNSLSKPQHMLKNSLTASEGVGQIMLYQKTLEVNDYILLRYQEDQYFIQSGNISRENALNKVLKLDDKSKQFFLDAINDHSQETVGVLTDKSGNVMLMFLYPMLNHLTESEDMIGFIIRGESLLKYLLEELDDRALYAVMQWESGEVLFEINGLNGVKATDTASLREKLLTGNEHLVNDYTYGVYQSMQGYDFCYALANDAFLANFNGMLVRVLLLGVLIFVIAAGMISVINHANVRRIINVRDELLRCDGSNMIWQDENEFRQIQYLIRKMYQEQNKSNAVREQIVQILCGGLIQKEEILEEMVKRVYPKLLSPYYIVLSVVAGEQGVKLMDTLATSAPFDSFIVEQYQDTTVLSFVLGCEDEDAEGITRRKLAGQLLQKAVAGNIDNALIAIGRICGQLSEISCSYQGMLSMTYYQLSEIQTRTKRVFLFEDAVEEDRANFFGDKDVERLKQAFINGTLEEVEDTLQVLLRLKKEESNALVRGFRRCILTEILCELLESQGIDKAQIAKLRRLPVEDEEVYEKSVLTIIRKCRVEGVPIEDILDYIDTHYKEKSMGLDALAAHFKMSVSAVSRYIKDQSGQKYTEYVSELRLNEACRLLKETDIKLQDIPYEIGYEDYVSFSKKFKAAKGIAPGKYRIENQDVNNKV